MRSAISVAGWWRRQASSQFPRMRWSRIRACPTRSNRRRARTRSRNCRTTRWSSCSAADTGDHHCAIAHGLHQAGHAKPRTRIELERIGEVGVESPHQHFGTLETGHRADEDAILADSQILAFDQQEAQIAREIGVLEISLIHGPRREHADPRIILAIERGKLGLKSLEERRQPLDLEPPIDLGHDARQREAVLPPIAGARGASGALPDHPPTALRRTPHLSPLTPPIPPA